MAKIDDFVSSLRPFSPAPEQPASSGTSSDSSSGSSSSGERSYRNPFYDSSKPTSSINPLQAVNPLTSTKKSFTASTQKYGENLAAAESALEQARNNMYGATDPFTEAELRKEFEAAQARYDEAKRQAQENAHQFAVQAEKDIAAEKGLPDISNLNQTALANGPTRIGEQELIPGRGQEPVYDSTLERTGKWALESAKAGVLGALSGFTGGVRMAEEASAPAKIAQNFDNATELAWTLANAYKNQLSDPENPHEWDDSIWRAETDLKGPCDAIGEGVYEQVLANAKKAAEEMLKPETDIDELYNNFNTGVHVDETNFEKAPKATSELANELSAKSAESTEAAKEIIAPLKIGGLLTDATINAVQMAIDGAVGLAGGTATLSLGMRAAGSKAQQAEAEGATFDQQVKAAALSSGIEILTEKLADGLAGAYGKGAADDVIDEIIRRFVSNDRGRAALKFLASGTSEAIEEVLSGAAEPIIDAITYNKDAIQAYTTSAGRKKLAAETAYSALVGFILGEAGGTVEAATGGIAESVESMREADAIQQTLEESGMSEKEAQKAAQTVAKALDGEDLTKKQTKIIDNPIIQSVFGEQIKAAKKAPSPMKPSSMEQTDSGTSARETVTNPFTPAQEQATQRAATPGKPASMEGTDSGTGTSVAQQARLQAEAEARAQEEARRNNMAEARAQADAEAEARAEARAVELAERERAANEAHERAESARNAYEEAKAEADAAARERDTQNAQRLAEEARIRQQEADAAHEAEVAARTALEEARQQADAAAQERATARAEELAQQQREQEAATREAQLQAAEDMEERGARTQPGAQPQARPLRQEETRMSGIDRAEENEPNAPRVAETTTPLTEQERNTFGEDRAEQQPPTAPVRTVETVQEELNPVLDEIATIDKAIEDTIAERNRQIKEATDSDERVIIKGQAQQVIDTLKAQKADYELQADALRKEQREIRAANRAAEKQRISEGREAKGAAKVPNPQPETHIDNRTMSSVGKTNVNAFQYDNPEVKPFFKRAAEILMRDLGFMQSSMRSEKGSGTIFGVSNQFLEKVRNYFGSTSEAIEACEQIIYDKGRENFANPKRVELFLDEMLTDGYETLDPSLPPVQASADYMNVKGQLEGGTEFDPRERAIQTEIESDFTGETTAEEAARIVDERKARTGFYDDVTRDGQEDASRNEGRRSFEEIDAEDTASMEEKYGQANSAQNINENVAETLETPSNENTPGTQQESTEAPSVELNSETETAPSTEAESSGETWSGPEVQTQSTVHDQLLEEEKARPDLNPENDTHIRHHDTEVDNYAENRISEKGHNGAREDLMSRNPAEWDDVDVRTAQMLLREELNTARELTGEEQDAAYRRIATLKNAYNKQGTEDARALRQRGRFSSTSTDIITEAADILYGEENQKNLRSMSPDEKTELMNTIANYAQQRESLSHNDTASLIRMIKELNVRRHTAGLFNNETGRLMSWFLNKAAKQDGGFAFLNNILGQQIRGLANDKISLSLSDAVSTIRFNNMLSNLATIVRNFIANPVMDISEALSTDLGLLADITLSKITGTRSIAADTFLFSKAKRKGATEAFIRSIIEEGLDAPLGTTGKYEQTRQGRTFKMDNGLVERILSTWSKYLNYGLKSTDELAKGGIREATQEGLNELYENGLISKEALAELKGRADYVAEERTLQKKDGVAGELSKIKQFNGPLGFIARQIMPFAQVPANATAMSINYTPAGLLSTLLEIGKAVKSGSLTASQQAKIVTSLGRNINAFALVGLSFFLAMKGVIRRAKDDDKDRAALEKSEGLVDTQLNLSALSRLLSGDDSDEQDLQPGDDLIGLGYLEYLSASMALGAALAEEYKEKGYITAQDIAIENAGAVADAVLSMPAVSQISSAVDAYNYSEAETTGGKVADAAVSMAGSIGSGYVVPNFLRGIAKGLDENERVTYTGDNLENNINYIKSGIPGLRETLPIKVDPLGNEVKRGKNPLVNFLNATVLPGEIKEYTPHDVTAEIQRVSEATGKSFYPDRNAPKSITYGDNKYELSTEERTEYLIQQGQRTDDYLASLFDSEYYKSLTVEQKGEAISEMESFAKDSTKADYLSDKGESYTSKKQDLLHGVQESGTKNDKSKLNEQNLADYVSYTISFNDAVSGQDYEKIDDLIKQYRTLNNNTKTVLSEQTTNLNNLLEYKSLGLGSEVFYGVRETRKSAQSILNESVDTSARVRLLGLALADIPESQKDKIINGVDDYIGKNGVVAYNALKGYGLKSADVYTFFDTALNCKSWKDTGKAIDSGGSLSADATAFALMNTPGLTDAERSKIFSEIKRQVSNKYNDWKNFTYASEVNYILNDPRNKATYSIPKTASASSKTKASGKSNPFSSGIIASTNKEKAKSVLGASTGSKQKSNPLSPGITAKSNTEKANALFGLRK